MLAWVVGCLRLVFLEGEHECVVLDGTSSSVFLDGAGHHIVVSVSNRRFVESVSRTEVTLAHVLWWILLNDSIEEILVIIDWFDDLLSWLVLLSVGSGSALIRLILIDGGGLVSVIQFDIYKHTILSSLLDHNGRCRGRDLLLTLWALRLRLSACQVTVVLLSILCVPLSFKWVVIYLLLFLACSCTWRCYQTLGWASWTSLIRIEEHGLHHVWIFQLVLMVHTRGIIRHIHACLWVFPQCLVKLLSVCLCDHGLDIGVLFVLDRGPLVVYALCSWINGARLRVNLVSAILFSLFWLYVVDVQALEVHWLDLVHELQFVYVLKLAIFTVYHHLSSISLPWACNLLNYWVLLVIFNSFDLIEIYHSRELTLIFDGWCDR